MSGSQPAFAPDPSLSATPAGLRERAYATARRHSARVRLLKVMIPIAAVAAAGLITLWSVFDPFGRIPGLTVGPVSLSGTRVTMEGPRLTGFRKDAKPYEVTASAAYQDVRKPNVIELKDMKANLVIDENGTAAHLWSRTGLFDTSREHLDLKDDIRITTDKGEEVLLRSASVDFKQGAMSSQEPVKITTPNGLVEAEGVQVSDNGRTFVFTGRVRTQFDRNTIEPAGAAGRASVPARVSQAEPNRP